MKYAKKLRKGDKVVAGQLIGTVASPSAYYIEEGPGVYFKLTQYGDCLLYTSPSPRD